MILSAFLNVKNMKYADVDHIMRAAQGLPICIKRASNNAIKTVFDETCVVHGGLVLDEYYHTQLHRSPGRLVVLDVFRDIDPESIYALKVALYSEWEKEISILRSMGAEAQIMFGKIDLNADN